MADQNQQAHRTTSRSVFIQSEKDDFFLHHPNAVLLGFLATVAMILGLSTVGLWIAVKLF